MKKRKLTAKEVEEKFNHGDDLTEFFTVEVDPVTHEPKGKQKHTDHPRKMMKIDSIAAKTRNKRNK